MATNNDKPAKKLKRGFASMTPEKRREIAAMGGRASHGGPQKRKPVFRHDQPEDF